MEDVEPIEPDDLTEDPQPCSLCGRMCEGKVAIFVRQAARHNELLVMCHECFRMQES